MACVTGVPVLYSEDGSIAYCGPLDLVEKIDRGFGEFLYLVDRLPTYVVALGALAGVVTLLLTALVVKELLS